MSGTGRDDMLLEDPELPGQKFVLLSFLSPEKVPDAPQKVRGVKVRGVFATREEAENQSRYLRDKIDANFDIYVGDVGKWLPWDDGDKTEDEEYKEKELNDLMRSYRQQRILSKQEIEKRKEDAIAEAAKKKK